MRLTPGDLTLLWHTADVHLQLTQRRKEMLRQLATTTAPMGDATQAAVLLEGCFTLTCVDGCVDGCADGQHAVHAEVTAAARTLRMLSITNVGDVAEASVLSVMCHDVLLSQHHVLPRHGSQNATDAVCGKKGRIKKGGNPQGGKPRDGGDDSKSNTSGGPNSSSNTNTTIDTYPQHDQDTHQQQQQQCRQSQQHHVCVADTVMRPLLCLPPPPGAEEPTHHIEILQAARPLPPLHHAAGGSGGSGGEGEGEGMMGGGLSGGHVGSPHTPPTATPSPNKHHQKQQHHQQKQQEQTPLAEVVCSVHVCGGQAQLHLDDVACGWVDVLMGTLGGEVGPQLGDEFPPPRLYVGVHLEDCVVLMKTPSVCVCGVWCVVCGVWCAWNAFLWCTSRFGNAHTHTPHTLHTHSTHKQAIHIPITTTTPRHLPP